MMRIAILLMGLTSLDGAAQESVQHLIIGEVEPTVCVHEGPLAKPRGECELVMIDTDQKSSTGYAIPEDLRSAFSALNRIATDAITKKLIDVYREDVDSKICDKDRMCAGWLTLELGKILAEAWGVQECSLLAKDLIKHGVNPTSGVTDLLLMAYRDMIIAPETDGIFTRYVRTEEQQPSIAMVYKFLIDRGYAISAGDDPCGRTSRK